MPEMTYFLTFSSSSLHFLHHFLPCGNSHKLKINFFATRGTGLTFGFTAKMLLYYFFFCTVPAQRELNLQLCWKPQQHLKMKLIWSQRNCQPCPGKRPNRPKAIFNLILEILRINV